jgi:hypothetical protein
LCGFSGRRFFPEGGKTVERFEFDSKTGANSNRKNGLTRHGVIELYPEFGAANWLSLDIRGPKGAFRGSAVIDKATAGAVGMALLKFAGFNVDVDLLVKQTEWLAGEQKYAEAGDPLPDEAEGILNLLGALRDLMEVEP